MSREATVWLRQRAWTEAGCEVWDGNQRMISEQGSLGLLRYSDRQTHILDTEKWDADRNEANENKQIPTIRENKEVHTHSVQHTDLVSHDLRHDQ